MALAVKALFFDVFGTLVDWRSSIARETQASNVFLGISGGLLVAAITAFGIITYTKPLRLWHERKIESDLHRGLPKVP